MPVRKDGDGHRRVEMELLVPGTPEEVWRAIATGPGTTGWFVPARIEERVGGALHFDFGANGTGTGEVTVWEPPRRFGYVEREWMEGAPPAATEITVTPHRGGQCVVRMVHSLFASTDDWDDQLEGFESGWPGFFEVLRLFLRDFPGQEATNFQLIGTAGEDGLSAWQRITTFLGVADASVGRPFAPTQSPVPLSGAIEFVHQDGVQRFIVARLDSPEPGIALLGTYDRGGEVIASLALYLYGGSGGEAAGRQARWQEWFEAEFPLPG